MRVYALYERSKKILAFLIVCFLAEFAVMLRMYINFSSTVKGQPKAALHSFSVVLIMSDSYKSTITRSLLLCYPNHPGTMAPQQRVSDPYL